MSKSNISLLPEFQDVLGFYGYDIDLGMKTQTETTFIQTTVNTEITTNTEVPNIEPKEPTESSVSTPTESNEFPSTMTESHTTETVYSVLASGNNLSSESAPSDTSSTMVTNESPTTTTYISTTYETEVTTRENTETKGTTGQSTDSMNTNTEMVSDQGTDVTVSEQITEPFSPLSTVQNAFTEVTPILQETENSIINNNISDEKIETNSSTTESYITPVTILIDDMSTMDQNKITFATDGTVNVPDTTAAMNQSETNTSLGSTTKSYTTEETNIPHSTIAMSTESNTDLPSSSTEQVYSTITGTYEKDTEEESEKVESTTTKFTVMPSDTDASSSGSSRRRREIEGYRLQWNPIYNSTHSSHGEMCNHQLCYPFLIDGNTEKPVPVMSYTAVFHFAYLRKLHATALEFPLDDDKYKLLLILPVENWGLKNLIYMMNLYPLRLIIEALYPTRVNVVIPSFMGEGVVTLTAALQKIGIRDIFDPNKANLSGMSDDPELHVKDIEQSIRVNIRNYMDVQNIQLRHSSPHTATERFYVTHPFLYFILDKETHVALIVGKVTNPLEEKFN